MVEGFLVMMMFYFLGCSLSYTFPVPEGKHGFG